MVAHVVNPIIKEAEAGETLEFEASQVLQKVFQASQGHTMRHYQKNQKQEGKTSY